jgi:hypothetical protein
MKWPRCRRHPTRRQLRRAAAAFAVAALRLPLVQRAAGADLEKLAALSEDPTRPGGLRGAPLLKTTPLTPERAQVLVALLRAEDPPAYAVQRWFYVVNETPEAWRTLRAAVDPLLDHLPTAREQVQALDTLLTTAPAASPLTVPAIYEDALKQLETIPGVVAALTDQFLNWKEVQRLIRRSAAGFGVAGADAVPKGAITMDDIMPAAAISPGITLPPPPQTETLAVNFHTDVKFPVSVQRRQINWLIVRLRLQKPETTAAAGVVPVEFTKIGDEEPPPEYLTVRVLAPDFDEETRRWERTITVRYDQDSDPAVFLLKSDELGKKRVAIDFLHKGARWAAWPSPPR